MRIYELLHDEQFFFIVSEYIKHGELYDFIVDRSNSPAGALTEREVKILAKQIFLALNYMHNQNIVHRDIKPENILMDKIDKLEIKLTDFGFATYYDHQEKLTEVLGSPIYMPPEIVKHEKYDSKADVWSAGVVTYVMLCGKPPFFADTKEGVY